MYARLGTLVLLLITASACANRENGQDPLPVGVEAGWPCATTSECREGLVCDPAQQICICTGAEGCPAGLFCHPTTGRCVRDQPGCGSDEACPSGTYCDGEARVCRQARSFCEPCERDGECGDGRARCVDGFCGAACTDDSTCPARTRCRWGQCVPELRCYQNSSRATGRCVDSCAGSATCPGADDVCEEGLCREPIGCGDLQPCVPDTLWPCEENGDCTRGLDQVCELGRCVARVSGCAHAESCDPVTLGCRPICTADADCREGRVCVAGTCRPEEKCQAHEDCQVGKVCACPKGRTCRLADDWGLCKPECEGDGDCPINMICEEIRDRMACERGCRDDGDCGPREICDPDLRTCAEAPGACKLNEVCPPCQRCVEGSCQQAATPETPYCRSCGDDSSCGEGGVCWAGSCAPPCGEGGCPSGFGCGLVESAGEEVRVCLPLDGSCNLEC